MTRNRELPQFGILEVSKDDIGRYVKIKATYPDGEITIRWGLDSLTYVNLKSAFSTRVFDRMPNLNYGYKLLNFYSSSRNPDETRDYSDLLSVSLVSRQNKSNLYAQKHLQEI